MKEEKTTRNDGKKKEVAGFKEEIATRNKSKSKQE